MSSPTLYLHSLLTGANRDNLVVGVIACGLYVLLAFLAKRTYAAAGAGLMKALDRAERLSPARLSGAAFLTVNGLLALVPATVAIWLAWCSYRAFRHGDMQIMWETFAGTCTSLAFAFLSARDCYYWLSGRLIGSRSEHYDGRRLTPQLQKEWDEGLKRDDD